MKRTNPWQWLFSPKSRRDRRRNSRKNGFVRLVGPEPLELRAMLSVSLGLSNNSFAENGGTDTVTAQLSGVLGNDVTVPLIFSGTATENTNFSASADSITIPAGSLSKSVTLTGIDSDNPNDESIDVSEGTVTGDTVGSPSSVTATLTGDPTVTLSDSAGAGGSFAENGGTDTVTATLSSGATGPITIDLNFAGSATNGNNYTASAASITIASGATSGTITLTGLDTDSTSSPDIAVSVGTTVGAAVGSPSSVDPTLAGDPTVTLSDSSGGAFAENGGTDTVTATLSSPATGPVTIDLGFSGTAQQTTNFSASSQVISIAQGATTGSITLTGVDSDTATNQDLTVGISSGVGAAIGSPSSVSTSLTGDPTVTLSDTSSGAFAENGGTDTVTATLSSPATGPVTIDLGFSGTAQQTTNFSASSQVISIAQGATTGSITLTGVDSDTSTDQDLTVGISSGVGAAIGSPSSVSTSLTGDPTVTLSDTSGGAFAENGGTDTVTATLSSPATGPVTIDLGFSGTAQQTTNFSASSQVISIAQGATTGSITLTGVDSDTATNQDLTVGISSGVGAAIGSPSSVSTSLTGDPTVTLSDTSGGAFAENGGTDTVTATLSSPATGPVTIDLGFSGTAQQTTNFSASSQVISIAQGATTGSITLTGVDSDTSTDQDLTVGISSGVGAAVGSPSSVSTSLTGDPTVSLGIASPTFAENSGADLVTALLSSPATGNVTIDLLFTGSATNGTNYTASATSITILSGQTSGTVTLDGLDTDDSNDEGITVTISGTTGAAISSPSVSATLDGDPSVSLSQSNPTFAENDGTDVVTATLSSAATGNVTINLGFTGSAVNGTNYAASAASITIMTGQTSGTVTLTGKDTDTTSNEGLTVSISSGTGAAIGSPSSVSTSLTGDPTASLSMANSTFAESAGTDVVTATLSSPATGPVTIDLGFTGTAVEGTNYSASPATITIASGQTTGSTTLTGIDTGTTSDEGLTVSISSGVGAAIGSPSSVTATLTGDAAANLAVNLSLSSSTLNENGGTDTVTATLSAAATTAVTVNLAFAGTATSVTDYSTSASSITIPVGSTTGTVTLTAIDQNLTTGSQTIIVSISSVSAGAVAGSTPSVTATINDNDVPAAPTSVALATSSEVPGLTNYVTTDTPSFTITAVTGATVQILVNGTEVATATEGTTAGQYTVTIPADELQVGSNSITTTAANSNGTSSPSTAMTLIYAAPFTEVYTVPGAIGSSDTVTFTYTSRNAAYNDEVGYVVVSDSSGTVNSIAPGASGYAQAALSSATELFSGATDSPGATKTETLTGGELIVFYLVQNNSTANFLASNPSDTLGGIMAFFSLDSANPDATRHVDTTGNPTTGNVQYSWEDMTNGGDQDYNDMVISVVPSTTSGQTGAALAVPGSSSDQVSLTFNLEDLAGALPGDVGIYFVTDASGAVNSIAPGGSGYAASALTSSNSQVLFAAGSVAGATQTITLAGGTLFGFYTINSGTTSSFLSANSSNSSSGSSAALFSFDASNPDSENHFRWFDPNGVPTGTLPLNSLSDPQLLHVMDQLFGGNAAFDSFDVGVQL